MTSTAIPVLETLFGSSDSVDIKLTRLMPLLGDILQCDRCALFLRDPVSRLSHNTHGWSRKPEYELTGLRQPWSQEPDSLPADDPMFSLALKDPRALYIEDIETAPADLLNREYEREHFGHRALIHAPIYHAGKMFGILEPCVFGAPRAWSQADRDVTAWCQRQLGPLAAEYVATECPRNEGLQ